VVKLGNGAAHVVVTQAAGMVGSRHESGTAYTTDDQSGWISYFSQAILAS